MRLLILLAVMAIALSCTGAMAATVDREVYIYKGGPVAQDGITVGGWGSGKAAESKESTKVLTGSNSIKITTQGFYSGGRIDFSQPVPLYADSADPKRYILFTFYFDEVKQIDPAAGTAYSYDIEPYKVPKTSKMRFLFVSDTGVKLAIEEPTNPLDPDDNWVRVAVPLAKFKDLGDATGFNLKRLAIFTDIPATLYLGEAKLVTDEAPIKVDSLSGQVVAIYDEVLYLANATGGVSSLKYSWDYDAGNGIQEESSGKLGKYTYTRGGEFTVTLTVSDADGLKAPVTVTAKVMVND